MDSYTQNLLERAKMRRRKMDEQLSKAGVTSRAVMPLKENTNSNIDVSPALETDKASPPPAVVPSSAKARLQRLGELYSGKTDSLPSPIQKAEDKILEQSTNPPLGNKCRLGRLNELASTINQWEDDLSRPNLRRNVEAVSPKKFNQPSKENSRVEKANVQPLKKTMTATISVTTVQSNVSGDKAATSTATIQSESSKYDGEVACKKKKVDGASDKLPKINEECSQRKEVFQWDQSMIKSLEKQGFARADDAKLVYEFGRTPEKTFSSGSPRRSPRLSPSKPGSPRNSSVKPLGLKKANTGPVLSPSRAQASVQSSLKPTTRRSPKMGVSALDKDSSVLKKAALFEQKRPGASSSSSAKDPAELSLSERKAMFEKNNGKALLPKVAFATPLPAKLRDSPVKAENKPSWDNKTPQRAFSGKQVSCLKEQLSANLVETTNVNMSKLEREKDMEILRNRWNKNKAVTGYAEECTGPAPPPPPMPTQVLSPPPPMSTPVLSPPPIKIVSSPEENVSPYKDSQKALKAAKSVKKIVMSPPKKGQLYPSLSDIEKSDDSGSSANSSLNQSKTSDIYLDMSFSDILEASKNNPVTPPRQTNESSVLNEMDELLDAALGDISSSDNEGPTPPKLLRTNVEDASASSSFEFERGTPRKELPSTPLVHSVSVYRRQQNNLSSANTPVKIVKREEVVVREEPIDEATAVKVKIDELLAEVGKQQSVISQASNLLSVCLANIEFSGSGEQVEGERLLLLAAHKRQACLNEIQRLKVEGTLRPKSSNSDQLREHGDLTIANITIPLKRDAIRAMAAEESMQYYVCLIKSDERVVATPVVTAASPNLKGTTLTIPGEIRLEKLHGDFMAMIEVYNMVLSKELLPHHIKYHLPGKKDKKLLTPSKSKKSQSRLVMPNIQSPAGPNAVRTSNFQPCGYVIFSLRELKHSQWTLNKVPYTSPLEGSIGMKIESNLQVDAEHRGFLSMFDDVSGLGAWHRRWCLLSSHTLSFWKYPDDENKKVPLGSIDLRSVITETVGLVSRDICARLHTFLLETTRPKEHNDQESLVLLLEGDHVRVRHLLSADTKEERVEWCTKFNKALALIRAWGCQPTH